MWDTVGHNKNSDLSSGFIHQAGMTPSWSRHLAPLRGEESTSQHFLGMSTLQSWITLSFNSSIATQHLLSAGQLPHPSLKHHLQPWSIFPAQSSHIRCPWLQLLPPQWVSPGLPLKISCWTSWVGNCHQQVKPHQLCLCGFLVDLFPSPQPQQPANASALLLHNTCGGARLETWRIFPSHWFLVPCPLFCHGDCCSTH